MAEPSQRGKQFFAGLRTGWPVLLGYIPVSFAFAVWAVGSGLPWQLVLLISMTNFTSAGQQAGAGLLAAGAGLPEIGHGAGDQYPVYADVLVPFPKDAADSGVEAAAAGQRGDG